MADSEDWDYCDDAVERIKMHSKTFKEFLNKRDLNKLEMDEVFLTSEDDFPEFSDEEWECEEDDD
ncbi:hypothetical protein HOK51_03860 [Candidatus Woesearchaeota archaeon]|jgi:hypothetical protein|nr:hypothetical protein [Candidatus Woesearchaeota archaeon]MBT6518958.1 hypothetical protein [Candidatus Woesearchaeota archaeon]MBT7368323.1 hypothetical protein [Candidatus Woesearchaeota archaeon]